MTGVATVLLVMVPGLFYLGLDRDQPLPLGDHDCARGVVSLAIANVIQRVRGGQELIELQRRVGEAILDTVDVGLVLLDGEGRYLTMNRRHHDFMRLAFPGGHRGQAGQLGEVFHEDGETLVQHEDMPTYRATQGEEFDDQLIWVGSDPLTRRALSVSSRVVREETASSPAPPSPTRTSPTSCARWRSRRSSSPRSPTSSAPRSPRSTGSPAWSSSATTCPTRCAHQLGGRRSGTSTGSTGWSPTCSRRPRSSAAWCTSSASAPTSRRLVRQSIEAARPAVEEAGLTLTSRVPEHLVVMVDPQRFAQVVDNLVSNAVKYTPSGGRVEVDLSVTHERVELVVVDTGIGISAARPPPRLQPVLPHPARRPAVDPGHRPGAEHHQGDRGQPRRPDRGRERGGPRLDLPRPAAPGRTAPSPLLHDEPRGRPGLANG